MKKFRMPALALSMATYFVFLMSFPAVAGLIPSIPSSVEMTGKGREAEINKIQKVLEMKIVAEKLRAYGLSADDVKAKVQGLSDEQLHVMAQASDKVLAGGDGLGVVIAILVIAILIVVLLKLMDKKVIIK